MSRTFVRGTKVRFSFSGAPHAPVNMADSIEEVNVGGKKAGDGIFATLYWTIFRITMPSFRKSQKFFGTFIASLDPETVQLPVCNLHTIRHVYRSVWPARKDNGLPLVLRSYRLYKNMLTKPLLSYYHLHESACDDFRAIVRGVWGKMTVWLTNRMK